MGFRAGAVATVATTGAWTACGAGALGADRRAVGLRVFDVREADRRPLVCCLTVFRVVVRAVAARRAFAISYLPEIQTPAGGQ